MTSTKHLHRTLCNINARGSVLCPNPWAKERCSRQENLPSYSTAGSYNQVGN